MRLTILPACSWSKFCMGGCVGMSAQACVHSGPPHTSFVFTQRVIWLMFKGVMLAESSPICTMAFTRAPTIKIIKEGWKDHGIMASPDTGLLDGGHRLFHICHQLGVIKNAARHLKKKHPQSQSDRQLADLAVPGNDHHGGARPSGGWTPFFSQGAQESLQPSSGTPAKVCQIHWMLCPNLTQGDIRK